MLASSEGEVDGTDEFGCTGLDDNGRIKPNVPSLYSGKACSFEPEFGCEESAKFSEERVVRVKSDVVAPCKQEVFEVRKMNESRRAA